MLVSSTKALLITVYTQARERALAMGIFSATLTAGAAAGLLLGGVLTSGPGWRWCLYVNVPVSLAAIAGAARVLPSVPGRSGLRLDVISALFASAGMTTLVYGLGEAASAGWNSAQVTGSLATSAVLLTAFVIRQAKRPGPLLPLRIVRDRNRGGALIALVINSLSTFGMMLVLTYQLQSVMKYSPLRTGLALIPFAVAAAIAAAFIAPWLLVRVRPRWLITAGIALSAAGLLPLTRLTPASPYLPLIFAAAVIEGLGTGLGGPPALNTGLRAVRPADAGAASAVSSTASQLGSSVGAALLNTIAATVTAAYLAAHAIVSAHPRVATHPTVAAHATVAAGTVRGYATAAAWGAAVLLVAAVPVGVLVNARSPGQRNATAGRVQALE